MNNKQNLINNLNKGVFMKNLIMMSVIVMSLIGCKELDQASKSSSDTTKDTPTDTYDYNEVSGQVYYNLDEILTSREKESYGGYEYQLRKLRVYLVGRNHAFRIYPDFDGNFIITNVEPGSYQLVVKSMEYFFDDKGAEYTFLSIKTVAVSKAQQVNLGVINMYRQYVDETDTPQTPATQEEAPADTETPSQNDETPVIAPATQVPSHSKMTTVSTETEALKSEKALREIPASALEVVDLSDSNQ